jgi:hypothetical protein
MIIRYIVLFIVVSILVYYFTYYDVDYYHNYTAPRVSLEDGYYVIRNYANGKYCSDTDNGVFCNKEEAGPYETFHLQHLGSGQYSMRSARRSLYCGQTFEGISCGAPTVGIPEVFVFRPVGKKNISIQNNENHKFCSDIANTDDPTLTNGLSCDIPDEFSKLYQTFQITKTPYENIR